MNCQVVTRFAISFVGQLPVELSCFGELFRSRGGEKIGQQVAQIENRFAVTAGNRQPVPAFGFRKPGTRNLSPFAGFAAVALRVFIVRFCCAEQQFQPGFEIGRTAFSVLQHKAEVVHGGEIALLRGAPVPLSGSRFIAFGFVVSEIEFAAKTALGFGIPAFRLPHQLFPTGFLIHFRTLLQL